MPKFAYEGRTAGGEVKKGKIEAADQNAARAQLRKMNINPTTLKAAGGGDINIPMPAFLKPKVTTKDLVLFTRQFATMIDSGLPLVQCLDIQAKQAANPTFREEFSSRFHWEMTWTGGPKQAPKEGEASQEACDVTVRVYSDIATRVAVASKTSIL